MAQFIAYSIGVFLLVARGKEISLSIGQREYCY